MQEELVRLAKQGDAEAFDALARLAGDRCLAIAVRILRDHDLAEDAVQAALIKAWIKMRVTDLYENRGTWTFDKKLEPNPHVDFLLDTYRVRLF